MFELRRLYISGETHSICPSRGIYKIGREVACNIVCASPNASRMHGELKIENGLLWIQDLKSMNGISIGGNELIQRNVWVSVDIGSQIWIGCRMIPGFDFSDAKYYIFEVVLPSDRKVPTVAVKSEHIQLGVQTREANVSRAPLLDDKRLKLPSSAVIASSDDIRASDIFAVSSSSAGPSNKGNASAACDRSSQSVRRLANSSPTRVAAAEPTEVPTSVNTTFATSFSAEASRDDNCDARRQATVNDAPPSPPTRPAAAAPSMMPPLIRTISKISMGERSTPKREASCDEITLSDDDDQNESTSVVTSAKHFSSAPNRSGTEPAKGSTVFQSRSFVSAFSVSAQKGPNLGTDSSVRDTSFSLFSRKTGSAATFHALIADPVKKQEEASSPEVVISDESGEEASVSQKEAQSSIRSRFARRPTESELLPKEVLPVSRVNLAQVAVAPEEQADIMPDKTSDGRLEQVEQHQFSNRSDSRSVASTSVGNPFTVPKKIRVVSKVEPVLPTIPSNLTSPAIADRVKSSGGIPSLIIPVSPAFSLPSPSDSGKIDEVMFAKQSKAKSAAGKQLEARSKPPEHDKNQIPPVDHTPNKPAPLPPKPAERTMPKTDTNVPFSSPTSSRRNVPEPSHRLSSERSQSENEDGGDSESESEVILKQKNAPRHVRRLEDSSDDEDSRPNIPSFAKLKKGPVDRKSLAVGLETREKQMQAKSLAQRDCELGVDRKPSKCRVDKPGPRFSKSDLYDATHGPTTPRTSEDRQSGGHAAHTHQEGPASPLRIAEQALDPSEFKRYKMLMRNKLSAAANTFFQECLLRHRRRRKSSSSLSEQAVRLGVKKCFVRVRKLTDGQISRLTKKKTKASFSGNLEKDQKSKPSQKASVESRKDKHPRASRSSTSEDEHEMANFGHRPPKALSSWGSGRDEKQKSAPKASVESKSKHKEVDNSNHKSLKTNKEQLVRITSEDLKDAVGSTSVVSTYPAESLSDCSISPIEPEPPVDVPVQPIFSVKSEKKIMEVHREDSRSCDETAITGHPKSSCFHGLKSEDVAARIKVEPEEKPKTTATLPQVSKPRAVVAPTRQGSQMIDVPAVRSSNSFSLIDEIRIDSDSDDEIQLTEHQRNYEVIDLFDDLDDPPEIKEEDVEPDADMSQWIEQIAQSQEARGDSPVNEEEDDLLEDSAAFAVSVEDDVLQEPSVDAGRESDQHTVEGDSEENVIDFFPELSQAFLEEIAEEEKAEQNAANRAEPVDGVPENLAEPSTSKRVSRVAVIDAPDMPDRRRGRCRGFSADHAARLVQSGTSPPKRPRITMMPPSLIPGRRKLAPKAKLQSLVRNYLPAGYTSSVNAQKAARSQAVQDKPSAPVEALQVFEPPKPFRAPAPVKVKVTEQTRSMFLLDPPAPKPLPRKRPFLGAPSFDVKRTRVEDNPVERGGALPDLVKVSDKAPKKRVNFASHLEHIKTIPARQAHLPLRAVNPNVAPASTVIRRPTETLPSMLQKALTLDGVRLRMLRWAPEWIKEMNLDGLKECYPNGVFDSEVFPQGLIPIRPNFGSLREYVSAFAPPMFVEFFAKTARNFEELRRRAYDSSHRRIPEKIGHFFAFEGDENGLITTTDDFWFLNLQTIKRPEDQSFFNNIAAGTLVKIELMVRAYNETTCVTKTTSLKFFGFVTDQPTFKRYKDIVETIHPEVAKEYLRKEDPTNPCRDIFFAKMLVQVYSRRINICPHPIDYSRKIQITVISTNVKSSLRQFPLLLKLEESPLKEHILRPTPQLLQLDWNAGRRLPLEPKLGDLNQDQSKSISVILSNCLATPDKPHLYLLQGPPGTGKTKTLVAMILQLLIVNPKLNVLLCAPSNAAVDELVKRLRLEIQRLSYAGQFRIIRVGIQGSCSQDAKQVELENCVRNAVKDRITKTNEYFSNLRKEMVILQKDLQIKKMVRDRDVQDTGKLRLHVEADAKYAEMKKRYMEEVDNAATEFCQKSSNNGELNKLRKSFMQDARIVATTLSSSSAEKFEKLVFDVKKRFDFCFIDEASQCTEPEVLQPLAFGMKNIILVGDHKQLQATVVTKSAGMSGFGRSMFARIAGILEHDKGVPCLRIQYRMHPAISAFPSCQFYDARLISGPGTDRMVGLRPYLWLDVIDSVEAAQDNNIRNMPEALLVARVAEIIRRNIPQQLSIGVISPYNHHKILVRKEMERSGVVDVQVDTVDAYQGREKDAIILSTVRAHGGIGFLSQPERLNVALTRAKYCLVICGHAPTMRKNELWSRLIIDAERRNVIFKVTSNEPEERLRSLVLEKRA